MTQRAFPILSSPPRGSATPCCRPASIRFLADQIQRPLHHRFRPPGRAAVRPCRLGLDRVIVMEKGKGKGHWFKLWNQVRHRKWGLVVDLRGSGTALFLRREKRAIWKKHVGEPIHEVIDAARVREAGGRSAGPAPLYHARGPGPGRPAAGPAHERAGRPDPGRRPGLELGGARSGRSSASPRPPSNCWVPAAPWPVDAC